MNFEFSEGTIGGRFCYLCKRFIPWSEIHSHIIEISDTTRGLVAI